GYLLLADISGYTAFLVGTELEHANAIVHELTMLIRERLSPPMRFVKLEGDAVFCHADVTSFEDGERLIELIESCYFDFSNRLLDMQRGTTCRCAACASIGSLDLKFVAHYGTYVLSFDGDREDLAGPDVILVHRLLKNTVGDGGGPQAYAFLTGPCMQRMPASFQPPSHSESYESFGQMTGGVHDLKPVIAEMREARRVYVASDEADGEVSFGEHPYPPAVVWQYFVDPEKRLRWQPLQTAIKNQPNNEGRLGRGASSHCAHGVQGDALREYLDWRPYSYFTNRFTPLGRGPFFFHCIETFEFTPTDAGTTVSYRYRLKECGPLTRLRFLILRSGGRRMLTRSGRALRRILDEDAEIERSARERRE
ncbi:MAG: DUF2652 domain-containing protein, partial [Actinomycetota bacterium]|nr:DUF2652 domain-containing protein [Actinomycetota bacterium]